MKDFYNDPEMKLNKDWRIIQFELLQHTTIEKVSVDAGETVYIAQERIENGWEDSYFCTRNGERIPQWYAWQEQEAHEMNKRFDVMEKLETVELSDKFEYSINLATD